MMSTPESIKNQLMTLIGQANAVTGNTDTDVTGAVASLIAGFGQGGGLPEGMNAFVLTLTESYLTQAAPGWTLTIPHGLGKVPGFAIVMRTTGITNAADLRGWIGTNTENIRYTNKVGYGHEAVPMSDSTAAWIYADETNLYCKSGGWGGSLHAGVTLFVGVLE